MNLTSFLSISLRIPGGSNDIVGTRMLKQAWNFSDANLYCFSVKYISAAIPISTAVFKAEDDEQSETAKYKMICLRSSLCNLCVYSGVTATYLFEKTC